jgi:hypothetical protein
MLNPHAFDQFDTMLAEWFAAAAVLVGRGAGRFHVLAGAQTDPVAFEQREPSRSSSSSSFLPFLTRVDSFVEAAPPCQRTPVIVLAAIRPTFSLAPVKAAREERIEESLSSIDNSVKSLQTDGRAKSPAWVLAMMAEFCDYRMQGMQRVELAGSALFQNPHATAVSMKGFEQLKFGMKKLAKQFEADFETSLAALRDAHPSIFCMHQFVTGAWGQHALDFYLMCREKAPRVPRFDMNAYAEQIFAPFGHSPIMSALSCVNLYHPENTDELLCVMTATFVALLAGRRHESLALFRRHARDGMLGIDSFMSVITTANLSARNGDNARLIAGMFSKEGEIKFTFDEFEVCALYCGFFADAEFHVKYDPFASLTDPVFAPIKAQLARPDRMPAIAELSGLLAGAIRNVAMPDTELNEVQRLLLRTTQIVWRNKPVIAPGVERVELRPTAPGPLAPRRIRLRSDLAAEIRTLSQLLPGDRAHGGILRIKMPD